MQNVFEKLAILAAATLLSGCLFSTQTEDVDAVAVCDVGPECSNVRKTVGLHRDISHMGVFRQPPRQTPGAQ